MAKTPVLNWYAKDPKLTKGLERAVRQSVLDGNRRSFATFRLGGKWARKLNPGMKVAISISDNSRKHKIIGYAVVISVAKKYLIDLSNQDLRQNIGAKNIVDVLYAMRQVYKPKSVVEHSLVTVIELFPW